MVVTVVEVAVVVVVAAVVVSHSPGLGLVQKVVYSGEGAGTGADPGHELNTLCGLTQC